jgi:hypothetical protein
LLKENHGASVGALGLFYSASALGWFLAAAWPGRLPRLRRRGLLLYGWWAAIDLLVMLIGLPVLLVVILAASLAIGVCNTTLSLAWVSSLQEMVPGNLLGRVSSVDYLGSYLFLLPGNMAPRRYSFSAAPCRHCW